MGIKLSDIAKQTKTIGVPFGDDSLKVTFNPNAMTPRKEAAFRAAAKEEDQASDALLGMLAETLVRWELLDDDDQAIGTTVDALRDVPNPIILRVLRAIGEENGADPTKSAS